MSKLSEIEKEKKFSDELETAILEEYIYLLDGDHYNPDYMAKTLNRIQSLLSQSRQDLLKELKLKIYEAYGEYHRSLTREDILQIIDNLEEKENE